MPFREKGGGREGSASGSWTHAAWSGRARVAGGCGAERRRHGRAAWAAAWRRLPGLTRRRPGSRPRAGERARDAEGGCGRISNGGGGKSAKRRWSTGEREKSSEREREEERRRSLGRRTRIALVRRREEIGRGEMGQGGQNRPTKLEGSDLDFHREG
ncbi:hypothetical protein [Oryza sativa Japonica Group]|uniref:Uncharacterized protein P0019D06.4 n=1 Tax=Oryza sativa subsp. japonica TaxID=39947 RepID=Q5ZEN8_ORYSJ|nr:hypothetical protein [Oryza sativa Japonica Group]